MAAEEAAKTGMNRQTAAIIFAAAAAFLFAVAVIEGESVWSYMHGFMFSVLGACAYVIPFLFLYISIVYAKEKSTSNVTANLVTAGAVLILVCSCVHIFSCEAEYLSGATLAAQISDSWRISTAHRSGGVVGALIGGGLSKLFGKTGAAITVVILLIVFLLLLTGTSLPILFSLFRKPVKKVTEVTEERMAQSAKRREERKKEEELEKEEGEEGGEKEAPQKTSKPLGIRKTPPTINNTAAVSDTLIEPPMAGVKTPKPSIDIPVEPVAPAVKIAEPEEKTEKPKKPAKKTPKPISKENKEQAKEPEKPAVKAPDKKPAGAKGEYALPPIDCLKLSESITAEDFESETQRGSRQLIETLESFKIHASVTAISKGPSVTRYELVPEAGVRINRITALADDIALRLAAKSVRIEAPIPGKAAIGIEVPNSAKSTVSMREVIDTDVFRAGSAKSKLNVALGKDIAGNIITADLAKMPHLLVAGTTGSGKSVCLNSMIISILYNASPDEVKLLMIDPKMVEFTVYNGISHLEVPVVSNPRKAAGALSWAVSEMEKRYALFAENNVRDIKGYNNLCEMDDSLVKMHRIVIFIDELSDLMMASPKEVEDSICRLAQMARAAGIHMVIATQRPSVDVITGIIKANIPSRISLFVSSQVDSRTILDQSGAEKLLGNGDMLFSPVGSSKPQRVQGCYISDEEVESVVRYIKSQGEGKYSDEIIKEIDAKAAAADTKKGYDSDDDGDALDPMFDQAAEVVIEAGGASTTMLQKKLKLGYARASRVMDQLEERGIVGPSEGAKPRKVMLSKQQWYEMQALSQGSGAANKNVQLEFSDASYEEDLTEDEFEPDNEFETDEPEEIEETEEDGFADIYEDDEEEPVEAEAETVEAEDAEAEEVYDEHEEYAELDDESVPWENNIIKFGRPASSEAEEIREEPEEEYDDELEFEEIEEDPAPEYDDELEFEEIEEDPAHEYGDKPEIEAAGEDGEPDEDDGENDDEDEDLEPVSIDDIFSDDDFLTDETDFFED